MRVNKHVKLSELVIIFTFVVMVVSTLTQVICRYLLDFSLPWVDELARYCLVWMVFIGMVLTLVRGQHVTVDLMLDRYSIRFRPLVPCFALWRRAFDATHCRANHIGHGNTEVHGLRGSADWSAPDADRIGAAYLSTPWGVSTEMRSLWKL